MSSISAIIVWFLVMIGVPLPVCTDGGVNTTNICAPAPPPPSNTHSVSQDQTDLRDSFIDISNGF